jgi:hypothetical protein
MFYEYKFLDVCSSILIQIQFIITKSNIYKNLLKALNCEL